MGIVLKFEVSQWYDKNSRSIVYGVDSIHQSGKKLHVCDNRGMIRFNTKEAAEKKIKKMNKEIRKYDTDIH